MKPLRILATALVLTAGLHAAEVPGSTAILLGNERVQKELKLTSLQRAVLNDIRTEYRDASRDITAKVAAGQQTKKQALANLEALTAGSNKRALRVLNPSQEKRLGEIRHQILGGTMLYSPAVQQKLGLSAEQKARIAKIRQKAEANVSKVNTQFEQGKISHNQRLTSLREDRLKNDSALIDVLTPEQFAKFGELEGEEFSG